MNELPAERSRTDVVRATACAGIVAFASLFSRKTGACGTAHWLFFRLMGGLISNMMASGPGLDQLVAFLLNVAVFCWFLRLWYRHAPARWYLSGLVVLTVLYLSSYFFFFPTRDCP